MLSPTSGSLTTFAVGIAAVVAAAFVVSRRVWGRKSHLPLPPGPPGEPLLGHLRIIPAERPEFQYAKWAKEYNTDIRKPFRNRDANLNSK
jgi:hypothetical protein